MLRPSHDQRVGKREVQTIWSMAVGAMWGWLDMFKDHERRNIGRKAFSSEQKKSYQYYSHDNGRALLHKCISTEAQSWRNWLTNLIAMPQRKDNCTRHLHVKDLQSTDFHFAFFLNPEHKISEKIWWVPSQKFSLILARKPFRAIFSRKQNHFVSFHFFFGKWHLWFLRLYRNLYHRG